MTHADLIEHVLPLFVLLVPTEPARAYRAWMTWWIRHAVHAGVEA